MTEAELRHAVLDAFHDLHEGDWLVIASISKGYLEEYALSDPDDVVPAVTALDTLLAYFKYRPT